MPRPIAWAAALVVLAGLGGALATPSAAAGPSSAALPAATSHPSPSPGSEPDLAGNVTYGLGPATAGAFDRRRNYAYLQTRGAVVQDQVAVLNLSARPLTLNLYVADALNQGDGTLGLRPRGAKSTDLASWITLRTPTGKPFVVVPARSTIIVPFTVNVPKGAEIGDHLAGIVTSLVAAGQTPGDLSTNVALEQRVGVRVALRVAGVLDPRLEVVDVTAEYVATANPIRPGSAVVEYTVRNTGNVRLSGRQQVVVHGLFGAAFDAGQLVDLPLLLPGGSARVSVVVPDVWPLFRLTADVTVTALSADGDANPSTDPATGSASFWAIPWIQLAIVLALALGILWWLRRRRTTPPPPKGRREAGDAGTEPPVPVGAADSAS